MRTHTEAVEVVVSSSAATIGTYEGQTVVLIHDPSDAGWAEVHRELARLGFGDDSYLTQLGWWEDGELWLVE